MDMLHELFTASALATLALLIGLELVLGIDNILVISLVVSRLPEIERKRARLLGLAIALIMRLIFVAFAFTLVHLTEPILYIPSVHDLVQRLGGHPVPHPFFHTFSIKDLVLLIGGLFLIYKSVIEINHVVNLKDEGPHISAKNAVSAAILQIVLLDIVFSVDSVITAVGLTQNLLTISLAVILSFVGLLFYAGPIGEFILRHTALKILALAFLVTIGVTLCLEGMHKEVDKGYIYLPMGFALLVELLQMRYIANAKRVKKNR
jgi:predicted tellurium resistance membrane protein TerC